MRFMIIVRTAAAAGAFRPPAPRLADAMRKYNEQLAKSGVLLAAEELLSGSYERFAFPVPGGRVVPVGGPAPDSKAFIAGFALIEVKSREEAVEWAFRLPLSEFAQGEIELRKVKETPDIEAG
ncbi:YciI family protein [Paenibacillus humicola]|uniref:YciI family protein n=1 Tax=Paenibacillus humicola TaxID=3110540 RepID=UPI00237AC680|nr:YciI family protein [Paenibacillus humicola]